MICFANGVYEYEIDICGRHTVCVHTQAFAHSLTCWHFGLCLNALNAHSDKPLFKNTFIYFNEVVPWMRLFICLQLLLLLMLSTMFMLFLWTFFFLFILCLLSALMAKAIASVLRDGSVLLSVFSLHAIMQTHILICRLLRTFAYASVI